MKKMKGFFKNKKRVIIVGALVLCVVGGTVFHISHKTANASEAGVGGSTVVAVTKQDLTKNISVNGTISSAATYNVSSEIVNVQIKEINVAVGDEVKAGDVLATLDATSLEKNLQSAQNAAGIASQQGNLGIQEAERNYNSTVANNDTAVNRSNDALNNAKSKQDNANSKLSDANNAYNAAVAELDAKNQAFAPVQEAYNVAKEAYVADTTNTANKAAYEQAEKDYTAAKAEVTAAEAAVAEAKAAQSAAQEGVAAANQGVTAAQQALDDANTTRTKSNADSADAIQNSKLSAASSARTANDAVTQAKEQVSKATLVAPADGVVTAVNFKAGDVYNGSTMIVVQDVSGYKATASLGQYDISDVFKGLSAVITTDTTGTTEMKGSVTFVSPTPAAAVSVTGAEAASAANTNATYPIEVTIDNPSDRLRIGMNAKVTITIATAKDALTIPVSALQQDEDGSYYVEVAEDADQNGFADSEEFKKVAVTQGLLTDYYVQIEGSEIKEGMYVVIPEEDLSDLEISDIGLF